jgi:hypothetical protein
MEILQCSTKTLLRGNGIFGQIFAYLRCVESLPAHEREALVFNLQATSEEATRLGLTMTAKHIEKFILQWQQTSMSGETLKAFLRELQGRLIDEVDTRIFLLVPADKSVFFETNQFSADAITNFPSAAEDMIEAGKCFSLSRYAASVFHLSRIVEAGLKALALELGVKLKHDWGSQLKEIEDELQKRYRTAGTRTSDEAFYSEAASQIAHIKNAWRNPTMHVERAFSEGAALDVFNAVKAFMRHVSAKLSEKSP